jgi:hypothetical protein
MRESLVGPNRQFAAAQHHACYGRRSGLSSDVVGTAVPEPTRKSMALGNRRQVVRWVSYPLTQPPPDMLSQVSPGPWGIECKSIS